MYNLIITLIKGIIPLGLKDLSCEALIKNLAFPGAK